MLYINNFNTLEDAKDALLITPATVVVNENNKAKAIFKKAAISKKIRIARNVTKLSDLTDDSLKSAYNIDYTTDHSTAPANKIVDAGYALTAEDLPILTAEGWIFKGWLINGVDENTSSETYYVNSNIVISAVWQEEQKNITVYIDDVATSVKPDDTFEDQGFTETLYNSDYYAYEDLWGEIVWCPIDPADDTANSELPMAGNYYYTSYMEDCVRWENCLTEDTMITMADGTEKPISAITHEDDILVWDFVNGCTTSAKPLLIKRKELSPHYIETTFSDGTILKTTGPDYGYHRIFNLERGMFTYLYTDTENGTTTYKVDGTFPTVVSQVMKEGMVAHYNVVTERHYNLFANGILTSCRLSNKFAIGKDMKYYGEQLISDEEISKYIAERKENTNIWL